MCMISGGLTTSTVCSLLFAELNRDNATDVVSVNNVVWVINAVALYRDITVIYFNNFSCFRMLIYLALRYHERQKSQIIRPLIYQIYHRNIEKAMEWKLNYIMKCHLFS